jgi:hypothetical protein
MNYDALYEPRVMAGNLPLEAFVVYEDEDLRCYTLRESCGTGMPEEDSFNQLIPANRCYRIGGKKVERGNKNLLIPKYTDRVMQIMYPGCFWIVNKKTAELLDCGGPSFMCSHDDFNNAVDDTPINLHQWRLNNPHLNQSFENISHVPDLQQSWQRFTNLGAHYNPDHMPDAFQKLLHNYQETMHQLFANQFWVGYLALSIHHELCMALELPRSTTDVRWNLMFQIISDDLQTAYVDLIEMVVKVLTVDIQESKHQRLLAVRDAVNTWFADTKINRIASKCAATHGEYSMNTYKKLFCHHMTQMTLHALDNCVLTMVTKNEK